MLIRKGTYHDKSKLYQLYKEVARYDGGIARIEEEVTELFIDKLFESIEGTGLIFVVEKDNEIVAAIHTHQYGLKIFDHVLGNLTVLVHPSYQNNGLGTELFQALLNEVENNHPGISRVELESRSSNLKAIVLYQKVGFKQEGTMIKKTRNADGTFEDSLLFAWFNKNFKSDQRQKHI